LNEGILQKEEAFTIPYESIKLDKMIMDVNTGVTHPCSYDIYGMAQLFKRWLRELPHPLLPVELYPKFVSVYNLAAVCLPAIETIDEALRNSLAFLIGFLKILVGCESRKRVMAISTIFGSLIARAPKDPAESKNIYVMVRNVLKLLIETWDVSYIYPFSEPLN
jgi:hypothetical protein